MIPGTISAHLARHLRAVALRYGVDPQAVEVLPGMDHETLGDDQIRIPTSTAWRLWELISALDIDVAGVAAAEIAAPGTLHVWDYLFATGDTLADGLRAARDYLPVMTDPLVTLDVIENGQLLTLRYRIDEPVITVMHEFEMAVMLRRVRDATGASVTPIRVAFANRAPQHHRYLTAAFGTENLEFDAGAHEITFLDPGNGPRAPIRDRELDQILTRYASAMMTSAKPPPDWHATFRRLVSEALARDEVSLDAVASRFYMSPRTLQRRLEERGTNWREEVEAVRHEQTLRLLSETGLTVASVAAQVGYADARTLRKAFVRWTGKTPDAYRRDSRN